MDVSEAQYRNEIESLTRRLRDRETGHAREIDNLQSAQRDQVRDLEESQSENIREIKEKADEHQEAARLRFDDEIRRNSDYYENALNDERREAYDRYGRLNTEHAREASRDKELRTKQFNEIINASKRNVTGERKEQESRLQKLRDGFEADRAAIDRYYAGRLYEQNHANRAEVASMAETARDQVDSATRRNHDELTHERLTAENRANQIIADSESEREAMRLAGEARERQLIDERDIDNSKTGMRNARAFDEYRKQAAEALTQQLNDNNAVNAAKDRDHSDRLAKTNHEHMRRAQDLKSEFRKTTNDLRFQLDNERDRNLLHEELAERKHNQDVYLNKESERRAAELRDNTLRRNAEDRIEALEDKHQKASEALIRKTQQALNNEELKSTTERQEVEKQRMAGETDAMIRETKLKREMAAKFQTEQEALENLRQRQLSAQQDFYGKELERRQDESQKKIYKAQRESQATLYGLQEELRNRTEELDAEHRIALNQNEETSRERLHRLSENYARTIVAQKESFDESADTIRQETAMRLARYRSSNDHEKRMQILDLQGKNRSLMQTLETKLSQLQDEHVAELDRLKAEQEKAMRDAAKKTKDSMDVEREAHARELETKDQQMKEKLKLQEEAFREEIGKLKRGHELSLKKS